MVDMSNIVQEGHNEDSSKLCFATTPVWKVVFLSIVTCGIYEIIWFYNCWKTLAKEFGYKVSPFWRGLFATITCFWLFSILEKYIKNFNEKAFSGIAFAVLYLILNLTYKLPDPYWLIGFASVILLAVIQSKINSVNAVNFKEAPQNNWSLANTLWAIPWTLIFLLGIWGTFLPD